jgi:hypothetical protein
MTDEEGSRLVIEVMKFLHAAGAIPTDRSLRLMCELHQRWPQLHFREFYLAALVGSLTALRDMPPHGNA